jgi:hypothetical protein
MKLADITVVSLDKGWLWAHLLPVTQASVRGSLYEFVISQRVTDARHLFYFSLFVLHDGRSTALQMPERIFVQPTVISTLDYRVLPLSLEALLLRARRRVHSKYLPRVL